jgi:GT2 family glycosyltransferase
VGYTPAPAGAGRTAASHPVPFSPPHSTPGPGIAVVVLAVGRAPHLAEAVTSVLGQGVPCELVVVASADAGAAAAESAAGLEVRVVERRERLFPGAARNAGIAATRAPVVAFLAADCLALPGWLAARVRRHREGALAVASAVVPHRDGLSSWATQISLFAHRMPGAPACSRLLYGASYDRRLFDRFGLFAPHLRSGEDTDFHRRLAGEVEIAWAPEVRTAHRHPRHLPGLLADQYRRGALARRAWRDLRENEGGRTVARRILRRAPHSLAAAWRAAEPGERPWIAAAAPLLPLATAAYALGALSPPAEPRRRLLALLAVRDEMPWLPSWYANVAPHVDGIVVLDDGSADGSGDWLAARPRVLEVVRRPRREGHYWEDAANHRLLVETAWRHDADWLLGVDADERLERDFRRRAEAEMERADRAGIDAFMLRFRELWNATDRVRVDGVWGQKRSARLFRARPDHQFHEQRLHSHWAPLNARGPDGDFHQADLVFYHLRMMRPEDRERRRDRYNRLDPRREMQAMGYDYMTDESGLVVERIPDERSYLPLLHPLAS